MIGAPLTAGKLRARIRLVLDGLVFAVLIAITVGAILFAGMVL